MSYYFAKTVKMPFDEAIARVGDALKAKGFGILTTIDVKQTLKKKLDVDFRPYTILGACNPPFAYKALSAEDKIGTCYPATSSCRRRRRERSRSPPSIRSPRCRRWRTPS